MKIIKLSVAFLICIVFLSCKKKADNPPVASNSGGSSNTTISPSTATSYYAIFSSTKSQAVVSGGLQNSTNSTSAYFSSSPVSFIDGSKVVSVDSVSANGRFMKYITYDYEYEDTTNLYPNYQTITFPVKWHVAGKNGIPGFTYTDNPMPSYTGYNLIPDTLDHNSGINFSLTGVSNVDGISVFVDDGSSGHSATALFMSNSTSISMSATDLSAFMPTNSGNISITFLRTNVENVYGKAMKFQSMYTITKVISVK
ncbi:MAG: hypothetical protein ACXVPN_15305 [Bacteroidia bacterium]